MALGDFEYGAQVVWTTFMVLFSILETTDVATLNSLKEMREDSSESFFFSNK